MVVNRYVVRVMVLALLLPLLSLSLGERRSAEGFTTQRNSCSTAQEFGWHIPFQEFTDTQIADLVTAFGRFSSQLDINGNPMVIVTGGVNTGWAVRGGSSIPGHPGADGHAHCPSRVIWVRTGLARAPFRNVATHELGHALNLRHTDGQHNFDGVTPYMATCMSFGSRSLGIDDIQSMSYKRDAAGTFMSNSGFEHSFRHWGFSGSHDRIIRSGGHRGNRSLGWKPYALASFINQSGYVNRPGANINARGSFRLTSGGSPTGYVRLRLYTRERWYGAASGCAVDNYPTGRDQNNVTLAAGGLQLRTQRLITPTSSWVNYDTNSIAPAVANNRSLDVRVEIASNVRVGGEWREIGVDNLRVMRTP